MKTLCQIVAGRQAVQVGVGRLGEIIFHFGPEQLHFEHLFLGDLLFGPGTPVPVYHLPVGKLDNTFICPFVKLS